MPCAGVILNGGKARRMGGLDKGALCFEGQSIVQRQITLLRPRTSALAMVGPSERAKGMRALPDRVGGLGPLDGLAAALAWSPSPWVLVVACDMPTIVPSLLDALLDACFLVDAQVDAQVDIVLASLNQPLLAVYNKRLLARCDAHLAAKQCSMRSLLEESQVHCLEESLVDNIDPSRASFCNVNHLRTLR